MFKITTDKSVIADQTGGGNYISTSGVYPVTINFASVAESKNGAQNIVFNVKYNGNDETIYGPYFTNNDGSSNTIGENLYVTLGIIAGLGDGDEFTVEEESHKVGKDQKEVDLNVIQELTGLDVQMHIQYEYSMYNGEIQERRNIRAFFSEDGASAEELINGDNQGKRLEQVLEKYASNITYKDGLDAEAVAEWKASKRSGSAKSTPKPKATKSASARAGSIFTNKK